MTNKLEYRLEGQKLMLTLGREQVGALQVRQADDITKKYTDKIDLAVKNKSDEILLD